MSCFDTAFLFRKEKQMKKKPHLILFLFTWFIVTNLASLGISEIVAVFHDSPAILNSNFWTLVIQGIADLITAIVMFWIIKSQYQTPSFDFKQNPFKNNWPSAWYLVMILFLAFFAKYTKLSTSLLIIFTALSIAICEELVFRAGVINALKRAIPNNPITWILISGFIFGAIHGVNLLTTHESLIAGLIQISDNICVGIILACMYLANHGSLVYPILIHYLIDMIGLSQDNMDVTSHVTNPLSLLPVLIFAILSLIVFVKKGNSNEKTTQKEN